MDTQKAKILVVDDEPAVLLTMTSILEREGYGVEGVPDGAAALEALRAKHYDLVLTDLNMPRIDGLAVLAEVRKRSPGTVTVMITGYGSLDSALEAVQLGAYEYLLKPIEVADLKMAVKRSLERKRLSEIDTLYRIAQTTTSTLEIPAIAAEVSQAVRNVLGVTGARVLALPQDAGSGAPQDELSQLLGNEQVLERLSSGSVITPNDSLPQVEEWAHRGGIAAFAVVPGIAKGELACAVIADNGGAAYDFHASALRFLGALANQTALAFESAALINELKRNNEEITAANEKLRELDQLKSKFLSVATHELRTPLSLILGYNSMLAEGLQDRLGAEEKNTLEESVSACKRLIRLVNSMLDLNQIQAGKMQMNLAREDMRPIASGVVALFQHEARRRNIRLAAEIPARLPRLHIDSERIQQVLINLVGNALKFTPEGGSVILSMRERREGRAIELAVRDTGIGIAAQEQKRIFDEFAQIRQHNRGRGREGSGLGLAIARRIVQAHDGTISVQSTPGQGSTFTVRLPLPGKGEQISAVSA